MVRGVLDKAEIHRMAHSKDECVRSEIADEIGSAFPYLTDREQAWKDLLALAKDEENVPLQNKDWMYPLQIRW